MTTATTPPQPTGGLAAALLSAALGIAAATAALTQANEYRQARQTFGDMAIKPSPVVPMTLGAMGVLAGVTALALLWAKR